MSTPPQPPSRLKVILTILFHSTCAISVTLVSKSALNGADLPVTLLALQTLVSVCLLAIIGRPLRWIRFYRPLSAWKSTLPLTLARLIGILAKTLCLAAVNASFYQIARGLLLPFTLLLSHLLLRPPPYNPPLALAACFIVMLGFTTGMISDIGGMLTSTKGLLLGVGSSFTTAVESVVVKRFLGKGEEGMWQLVFMSSVMQLFLYAPLFLLSGEAEALGKMTPEVFRGFVTTALATGVASFCLTLATFLQISVTSPTTHMIVTAARGVAQSALAVVILGEKVTAGRIMGMGFILGGSVAYGWAKDRVREQQREGGYQVVGKEEDVEMGEKVQNLQK
ncbi:hypothetical protein FPQ18DRAFT_377799 [Pyronema domesticum]|uniref:Similar to Uncharacterized transporter C22F8.04 acc. no. Q9UUI8 n=1 Tax=Pyronema omphalodes (strain CBS 100304) TaxID=1076935 RepID=U4LG03_PYROM|nr:hypothetical protein FPQ18DRAFT_377799 [Pyronema domesticum]CCX14382.1 Similar to Uncharacterized transporter C22F8.04; acc. no. Q9UUI8 [Pyronema omphalodes CBS 100304]